MDNMDSLFRELRIEKSTEDKHLKIIQAKYTSLDPVYFIEGGNEFADLRAKLIRSGELEVLLSMIQRLLDVESIARHEQARELLLALMLNAQWHAGRIVPSDTWTSFKFPVAEYLRQTYLSYIFNSIGDIYAALNTLDYLPDLKKDESNVADRYLGIDTTANTLAWRMWNLGEALEPMAHAIISKQVNSIIHDPSISLRSKAFLAHTTGVYLSRFCNFKNAEVWLSRALVYSERADGTWTPRIVSALSYVNFKLDRKSLSHQQYKEALKHTTTHFGPAGWQLRLAETAVYHGYYDEGMAIGKSVRDWTREKGQTLYLVWSIIFLNKFFGAATDNEVTFARTYSAARKMRRAMAMLVEIE